MGLSLRLSVTWQDAKDKQQMTLELHLVDFGIPTRSGGNFPCLQKSPPPVNNTDFLDFLLSVTLNPLFRIPCESRKVKLDFCQGEDLSCAFRQLSCSSPPPDLEPSGHFLAHLSKRE